MQKLVRRSSLKTLAIGAIALASSALALVTGASDAQARVFVVEDTADQGDNDLSDNECKASISFGSILRRCTFAAAMQQANASSGQDTIILEAKTYRIKQSDLPCDDPAGVIVLGAAAGETLLDRDGSTKNITCTGPLELHDVTIANGQTAAIRNGQSPLLLNNVIVRNNVTVGNANTGGVDINGPATIRNSTFTQNQANTPNAIASAINVLGPGITIENSTFHDNVANGPTAKGVVHASGVGTLVTIRNSTFSRNRGTSAALTQAVSSGFNIQFSTFVDNAPASIGGVALTPVSGSILTNSLGLPNCLSRPTNFIGAPNIDSGNSCQFDPAQSLINTNPLTGALGANGGATLTHAIDAASPAIDAVPVGITCPSTDQRGTSRPQDSNLDGVSRCDIGSFERRRPLFGLPGGLGVPSLSPGSASVTVGQRLLETFVWDVPAPESWLALGSLELRLRDPQRGIVFWVRWDQLRDTFVLLNADGSLSGARVPTGVDAPLTQNGISVDTKGTTAQGSGPTGQRVTLTLPLTIDASLAGRTLQIELSAQNDDGAQDAFFDGGRINVVGGTAVTAGSASDPGHGIREKDHSKPLTEEGRLQRQRTSRLSLGDERTEGNVLRTHCGAGTAEVEIANVDGVVTVTLMHNARAMCSSIVPGQYLMVEGTKLSEAEFEAHEADVE